MNPTTGADPREPLFRRNHDSFSSASIVEGACDCVANRINERPREPVTVAQEPVNRPHRKKDWGEGRRPTSERD